MADLFYMDNIQCAVNTERELMHIYELANKECKSANLPLQTWNTNNKELIGKIKNDYNEEPPIKQNVLGLVWDTHEDTVSVKTVQYPQNTKQILTKRSFLSLVSRLFDPLGLLSPLTVRGKILIQ